MSVQNNFQAGYKVYLDYFRATFGNNVPVPTYSEWIYQNQYFHQANIPRLLHNRPQVFMQLVTIIEDFRSISCLACATMKLNVPGDMQNSFRHNSL